MRQVPIHLALPAGHRLADDGEVRIADLVAETIVMFPREYFLGIWDHIIGHLLPTVAPHPDQVLTQPDLINSPGAYGNRSPSRRRIRRLLVHSIEVRLGAPVSLVAHSPKDVVDRGHMRADVERRRPLPRGSRGDPIVTAHHPSDPGRQIVRGSEALVDQSGCVPVRYQEKIATWSTSRAGVPSAQNGRNLPQPLKYEKTSFGRSSSSRRSNDSTTQKRGHCALETRAAAHRRAGHNRSN